MVKEEKKNQMVSENLKKQRIAALGRMMTKCAEGIGFVVFAAVLTEKKDAKGFDMIDFHYERHQFSVEDLKEVRKALDKHIQKDILGA